MSRLTWKKPDGTWGLVNGDIKEVPREYYGYMCKLKDYEETGLDPNRIEEVNELYLEKCKEINLLERKIAAYETERRNMIKQLEKAVIGSPEALKFFVKQGIQFVSKDKAIEIVTGGMEE